MQLMQLFAYARTASIVIVITMVMLLFGPELRIWALNLQFANFLVSINRYPPFSQGSITLREHSQCHKNKYISYIYQFTGHHSVLQIAKLLTESLEKADMMTSDSLFTYQGRATV